MDTDDKRGQSVALGALVLQGALAGLMCVVWLYSDTSAAKATFLLIVGGLPLWAITAVLFYCRHLAELEHLELDELAKSQSAGLFGEDIAQMRLAHRRLELMRRFVSPAVTLALAGYLLAMGVMSFPGLRGEVVDKTVAGEPLTWAFACLGGAFLAFLFGRYAIGMAKDPQWRLLRAGGGFLTLSALASGLLCAAFFLAHANMDWGLSILPYAVPGAMIVLAVELLMNFVLDFYRPRTAGVDARPGFDSRLVNLLSEPGSIAHSIAEALNYQFGFEVSRTWFYQLLRKALVPLVLLGAGALFALSSIVIVTPGQQAVVLTWGAASPNRAVLEPGVHFKLPWPIQTAEVLDCERIRTITLGVTGGRSAAEIEADVINGVRVYLWRTEHGERKEVNFLVAREEGMQGADASLTTRPTGSTIGQTQKIARQYGALGLLRMVVVVHYKVRDAYKFRYGVTDAETLLVDLATRELTHYAAQRDVDTLISSERAAVARQLQTAITAAADDCDLGVEVVLVSPHGIHPPTKVADAFEEVIKADLQRAGKILTAEAAYNSTLSKVAGTTDLAKRLAESAAGIEPLKASGSPAAQVAAAERQAQFLLDEAGGEAKTLINQMKADRWRLVNEERGLWESFRNQLAAYRSAPSLYRLNEKLRILGNALKGARKYVLGVDRESFEIRYSDDRRTVGGGFTLEEQ
ncbi:MAG: hypothetical protein HQ546_01380 [Planctomycetes bacterium]|nr:hypothetical protein [Planctomycetota bacterium]